MSNLFIFLKIFSNCVSSQTAFSLFEIKFQIKPAFASFCNFFSSLFCCGISGFGQKLLVRKPNYLPIILFEKSNNKTGFLFICCILLFLFIYVKINKAALHNGKLQKKNEIKKFLRVLLPNRMSFRFLTKDNDKENVQLPPIRPRHHTLFQTRQYTGELCGPKCSQ